MQGQKWALPSKQPMPEYHVEQIKDGEIKQVDSCNEIPSLEVTRIRYKVWRIDWDDKIVVYRLWEGE